MKPCARSEPMWRAASALATAIGLFATIAPPSLLRLFGVPARDVSGPTTLGWRLFGIRTAFIGAAALSGSPLARRTILPVQIVDQLAFVYALTRREVPARTAALAMATSGVLIAATVTASTEVAGD